MIKEEDFKALLKVFRSAVTEMTHKDTFLERKAVVADWASLMGLVDQAMGGLMLENDKATRIRMLAKFEENLKDFDYVEDSHG